MTIPIRHSLVLDGYELLGRLGKGGMGAVFRAKRSASGEIVAIKTVHARDEYRVRALRAEISALERLRHPGIVRLLDSGLADGLPWYAMELIDGPSLRDRIRSAPEDTQSPSIRVESILTRAPPAMQVDSALVKQLVGVVASLCEPLGFLHGEGLVHRDLKPENIYLRPDGQPVLIDFGLAVRFGGNTARDVLEFGGRPEGTLSYMAPEQLRGEVVDARADLYSLGCILYELLTGTVPFPGGNWQAAPAPPIAETSAEVRLLIARLLAEKPRDRLGYASDVANRLQSFRMVAPTSRAVPRSRDYLYRSGFVGRSQILTELRVELDAANRGQGRLMCIAAPIGTGKTRLVVELGTQATLSGFVVLAGECSPQVAIGTDAPRAVGPALHPLRAFFRFVADCCRDLPADRLIERFGPSLSILALFEPALEPLARRAGVAAANPTRAQVLEHVAATLVAFARDRPLLLILDDLHWADDLTLALLTLIAEMPLEGTSLVVVGTYRIEDTPAALKRLADGGRCRQFQLRQLTRENLEALVSDMLALADPPRGLMRLLADKSAGNPFFVAETLRCAVDERWLRRDHDGQWFVAGDLRVGEGELPLSSTLEELIIRRLESLPRGSAELLELLSVFGLQCSSDWLRAASGPARVDLAGLDELLFRQVVDEPTPGTLHFSHQKLQEIVHGRLPPVRRRALHLVVANLLEEISLHASAALGHDASLATHWEIAGDLTKARLYLERAGERALLVGAHADASLHLERLLDLPLASSGPEVSRQRARWHRLLANARFGLGDISGCIQHATRVFELVARSLPDSEPDWLLFLLRQTGQQLWHLTRGRIRKLPAPQTPDPIVHEAALAAERLAESYYFRDRSVPMVASVMLAVNLAERGGGEADMSAAYAKLGYIAGLLRAEGLGRRYFETAERLALKAADRAGLASAHYTQALNHLGFGRWSLATHQALAALAALEGTGDRHQTELSHTMLGHAEFFSGNPRAALSRFADVRNSARTRSNKQHEAWGSYAMARSLLATGELDAARALLEEAGRQLEHQPDRASIAICGGLRASVYLAQEDLPRARAWADDTLSQLSTTAPTAFSMLSAFTGTADTYLSLWQQQSTDKLVRRNAREICRQFTRFAGMFPMAAPAAARCAGWLHRLLGHPQRARRLLERSLRLAGELGMPLERQASAHRLTQT